MTAIAYRDGIMAADSVGWTADCHVKVTVAPKIKRRGDGSIFGASGNTDEIKLFCEWVITGATEGEEPSITGDFGAILVTPDGKVWACGRKCVFYEFFGEFIALGMPEKFMYGALFAGASAEETVRLAVLHTDGAGGTVQVEKL